MPNDADRQNAWALIDKIGTCMLVTHDGGEDRLRARPMSAVVRPQEDMIYFLVDAGSHKNHEVEDNRSVCLAFVDTGSNKYVSVTGSASVSNDRAKIAELFSPVAKAWWKDEHDPSIRILKVSPTEAEFWNGPGKAVSLVKMALAALTGNRPDYGENKKTDL